MYVAIFFLARKLEKSENCSKRAMNEQKMGRFKIYRFEQINNQPETYEQPNHR